MPDRELGRLLRRAAFEAAFEVALA